MAKFVEKKIKCIKLSDCNGFQKKLLTLPLFLEKIVKFGIGGHPLNYIYYKTAITFKSEI